MCKKKLAKFIFKLLAAAFMASVSWVQFNAGTLRKLLSVDTMKIYQNYILNTYTNLKLKKKYIVYPK